MTDMSGPGGSRGALTVTSSDGSITHLIGLLKEGDRAAAQPLWDAYFTRIVALARAKLRGAARRAADEEDVALSAFDSFCRRAERGQFPRLDDRDDLWQLLFVLTVRKAVDLVRYEGRAVRGGGRLFALADLSGVDVDGALGSEASPALAAQMADELERLAARLTDESLRNVMSWKMDGWTNREIAWRLSCTEKTVERKLRSIRRIWGEEGVDERGGP
jgi:DNA-directed RNA polymerase specialized sigma24 family protein